MPTIDVVADANIALKWFHQAGEGNLQAAVDLLDQHRARRVLVHVLDLTFYEIGNALMRGHARATAAQATTVLGALREICPTVNPDHDDLALATNLAAEHDLTLYDAAYAAVAKRRDAPLVTLDRQLLDGGLAITPSQLLAQLTKPGG
jgi:predicted nucleic acid-binding protein